MTDSSNFDMRRGDNRILVIEVRNADDQVIDLTGNTITFRVARNRNHAPVLSKTTDGGGIEIEGSPTGICEVTIDATDTAVLIGDYVYELRVYGPDIDVAIVLDGRIAILPDIPVEVSSG